MGTYVGQKSRPPKSSTFYWLVPLLVLVAALGWHERARWLPSMEGQPSEPNQIAATASRTDVSPNDSANQWIAELNGAMASQQWATAEARARRLTDRFPGEGQYWLLLGQMLVNQTKGGEALVHLRKARELGAVDSDMDAWFAKAEELSREESEYGQLHSPHFDLAVEGGQAFSASGPLFAVMESEYDRLCLVLNHYPTNRLRAVVREGGPIASQIPDWTGALFDGIIRIPLSFAQQPEANSRILRHEITHAFTRDIAGRAPPTWFDEGLAQALDGTRLDSIYLRNTEAPNLAELESDFLQQKSPEQARRLYQWSLALVSEGMLRGPGYAGAHAYLLALKQETPSSQAFAAQFHLTPEQALAHIDSVLTGLAPVDTILDSTQGSPDEENSNP